MKKFLMVVLAVLVATAVVVGCSAHKVADPVVQKPAAQGDPDHDGDGGGDQGGSPPPVTFDLPASTSTLTSTSQTVDIPVTLSNFPASATGNCSMHTLKGMQFTITLSSGLKLVPNVGAGDWAGDYLTTMPPVNGVSASSPIWSSTQNQDGSVTIVGAICCGYIWQTTATADYPNGGVLAVLHVGTTLTSGSSTEHITLVASPSGAGTASPYIADCGLYSVPCQYGHGSLAVNVSL